jgi:hypothetical protein
VGLDQMVEQIDEDGDRHRPDRDQDEAQARA